MTTTSQLERSTQTMPGGRVGSWIRYLAVRVSLSAVMLVVLAFASFLLVRLIPGDPARLIAGPDASPQLVARLREQLGLDVPFAAQLREYVVGLVQGDLGTSLRTDQEVSELIAERLPHTLQLTIAALLLAVVLGLALGIAAAYLTRNGSRPFVERSFVLTTGAVGVVPEVAIGALLVALLAVQVQVFPASGTGGLSALVLPALTVGLRPGFNLARVVRVEMLEVLAQPYIQTAHSKRLPELRVALVHALPNTMNSVLTLSGLLFAYLIGGVVVVENLFAWPGLGSTLVSAVVNRDYPVIQATVLVMGALVVIANLVVDVVLGAIDPRIALRSQG